jgi:uncharacterized membrane-anchored protein
MSSSDSRRFATTKVSYARRPGLRKVPEITIFFWIIKLLTTAMGEATSDFLVFKINPYVAVICGAIALAVALLLQFRTSAYNAWIYWLSVSMVAIFGTMAADGLHIQLGVPYIYSTIFFGIILALVFIVWQKSEKTLSIHTITTSRRETFYWATVLATFALGTAVGDLTATTFGLGYFSSGLLFTGLFILPALAYRYTNVSPVLAFWCAYVLTRPLGASFADWMSKSPAIGGLGWGDGHVAVVLTLIILAFVTYLSLSRIDVSHTSRTPVR